MFVITSASVVFSLRRSSFESEEIDIREFLLDCIELGDKEEFFAALPVFT